MSLLDIARELSVAVAENRPETVQGDTPFARMAVQFINETGRELARRVDWNVLRRTKTVTGDGIAVTIALPADFSRMAEGLAASANGNPVRGSLSPDEWSALSSVFGVPRYYYLSGINISFYPAPAATQTVDVTYQTSNWAKDADAVGKSYMSLDNDEELLPRDLLVQGAVWRWFRHAGRDFSDYMAEYEAAIADLAKAGNGVRQP